jgi:16S rRNA (cytosine967-C5)-methyltransferase
MAETPPIPTARSIAAHVLQRVLKDRAYAAAALDAEFERTPELDPRDRALATEIAYGALRTRGALLEALRALAPRGLKERDYATITQLLVAAYQILFLSRVPAFAAVDDAVRAIRSVRGKRVAGFANALLRRLADQPPAISASEAILANAPGWLRAEVEAVLGAEDAVRLLGGGDASGEDALVGLRVRAGAAESAWLEGAVRGRLSPLCRKVPRSGDLRRRPEFEQGLFVIQEEAAQFVALALGVRPGERVLDACAGRGQKTMLFTEQLGDNGEVWAADLHPSKLEVLRAEHARLGLRAPETRAVDWTRGPGDVGDGFDRVLVDAPCSGIGTLRRRPELLTRLGPGDPARLAEQAAAILRRAATRTRAGGRVVFAVCSVLRVESEEVVERVADVLLPAPFDAPEVVDVFGASATSFRLHPAAHGTDGFFVASFVRPS